MTVSKEQVLAALAKVPSPGGMALPDARVLSDVVVSDGKVFFSLTVDAAAVKAWNALADWAANRGSFYKDRELIKEGADARLRPGERELLAALRPAGVVRRALAAEGRRRKGAPP